MQVKDIMLKEIIKVNNSTTLRQLLNLFSSFHLFPLVPVVEDDNKLTGIISFRNLMNVFLSHRPEILKNVPFLDEEEENIFAVELSNEIGYLVIAEDIMERKFISIKEDTPLEEVYRLMKLNLKEEIPVVDSSGKLVGIIGIFDIIRQIFYQKGVI